MAVWRRTMLIACAPLSGVGVGARDDTSAATARCSGSRRATVAMVPATTRTTRIAKFVVRQQRPGARREVWPLSEIDDGDDLGGGEEVGEGQPDRVPRPRRPSTSTRLAQSRRPACASFLVGGRPDPAGGQRLGPRAQSFGGVGQEVQDDGQFGVGVTLPHSRGGALPRREELVVGELGDVGVQQHAATVGRIGFAAQEPLGRESVDQVGHRRSRQAGVTTQFARAHGAEPVQRRRAPCSRSGCRPSSAASAEWKSTVASLCSRPTRRSSSRSSARERFSFTRPPPAR